MRPETSGSAESASESEPPFSLTTRQASYTTSCACWGPICGASPIITASATIKPRLRSRFLAICFSSTMRPPRANLAWLSAPAVSTKLSGIAIHSACQGPVARSKSWIMASSIRPACWRTPFEAASISSDEIGLRFCGIVEDAPRPLTKGSYTSANSVEAMIMTSSATLPSEPVINPTRFTTSANTSTATHQADAPAQRGTLCVDYVQRAQRYFAGGAGDQPEQVHDLREAVAGDVPGRDR